MGTDKHCPDCDVAMEYRLGTFECPQCGRQFSKEDMAAKAATSGPGFRREEWQRGPDSVKRTAPGEPSLYDVPEEERENQPRPVTGLDIEKKVFFGIAATLTGLSILGSVLGLFTGGNVSMLLTDVFWELVYIFALSYVLFAGEAWAKGVCAVLLIIDLVIMIGSSFFVLSFLAGMSGSTSIIPLFFHMPVWIHYIISFAWSGWLLWILFRDNQIRNEI